MPEQLEFPFAHEMDMHVQTWTSSSGETYIINWTKYLIGEPQQ